MTTSYNFRIKSPLYLLAMGIILSSCGISDEPCEAPNHWLKHGKENPELLPKSKIFIDDKERIIFNNVIYKKEDMKKKLYTINNMEIPELIEIHFAEEMPCAQKRRWINFIDKTADCEHNSYCRLL